VNSCVLETDHNDAEIGLSPEIYIIVVHYLSKIKVTGQKCRLFDRPFRVTDARDRKVVTGLVSPNDEISFVVWFFSNDWR
jgi:hypothetical protein